MLGSLKQILLAVYAKHSVRTLAEKHLSKTQLLATTDHHSGEDFQKLLLDSNVPLNHLDPVKMPILVQFLWGRADRSEFPGDAYAATFQPMGRALRSKGQGLPSEGL